MSLSKQFYKHLPEILLFTAESVSNLKMCFTSCSSPPKRLTKFFSKMCLLCDIEFHFIKTQVVPKQNILYHQLIFYDYALKLPILLANLCLNLESPLGIYLLSSMCLDLMKKYMKKRKTKQIDFSGIKLC